MAAESQILGEETSSIVSAQPPKMSRPGSIISTGSAGSGGSHDRHMLVRYDCSVYQRITEMLM